MCREVGLAWGAEEVLPASHRGRVSWQEWERYTARLPHPLQPSQSEDSCSSCGPGLMDLAGRLAAVTAERDQLRGGPGGRGDHRWEVQCQRYEERITELHSVIAELSRKMEECEEDVIKEESEGESCLDTHSITTDSCMEEKLGYQDEYEDYTSLAFERDLELHTRSLKRGQPRPAQQPAQHINR